MNSTQYQTRDPLCRVCFRNNLETRMNLEFGFCPICDDAYVKGIKEMKNLSIAEIEYSLYQMYDELETAPYNILLQMNIWINIYNKELTARTASNCEGCKTNAPNQQGHMGFNGCLSTD